MKRRLAYVYDDPEGDNSTCLQSIEEVKFRPNLINIHNALFYGYPRTTCAISPDLVIAIEGLVSHSCKSFIESIGACSLRECPSLQILYLPPNVYTINEDAFAGCKSIRTIIPQQKHTTFSLRTIKKNAFAKCESLISMPYFPALQIIEARAFFDCESLTEVTLGSSVISAARDSFGGCTSLKVLRCIYREEAILPWAVTHVTIDPNTVKISDSAFANCFRLHSITITHKVTRLGHSSFWGCGNLPTTFKVPDTVLEVGVGAFARCIQVTENASNLPSHAMQDTYYFVGGKGEDIPPEVEDLVIGENVTDMKDIDLSQSDLEHLSINAKHFHINEDTFSNCRYLRDLSFQNKSVITIEKRSFYNSNELCNIKMPQVVGWILEGTYSNHTSPQNRLTLPIIHQDAFEGCPLHISNKYNRYAVLQCAWDWISKMETRSISTGRGKRARQFTIEKDDIDILKHTFVLEPPAPNEVIDTIVYYLQRFDFVFSNLPCDLVRKVVEFF
mmetsp:Transcript_33358/g.38655  ORF Transcript_33358/g.38655 Transcript_33358/m.38655 type:complete len:502 (-) Transcript_33358:98-1603(-)